MLVAQTWMLWNRMFSKFFSTFKEMSFNESKFPTGIVVLDNKYKHLWSQNNNKFYLIND